MENPFSVSNGADYNCGNEIQRLNNFLCFFYVNCNLSLVNRLEPGVCSYHCCYPGDPPCADFGVTSLSVS